MVQDIASSNTNHVVSSTTNIQHITTGKQTSQHHLDLQKNIVQWVDQGYKILKEEKVGISNNLRLVLVSFKQFNRKLDYNI